MLKHPLFVRIAEIAAECNYAQRRLLELQRPWLNKNSSTTRMYAPNDSTTRTDVTCHVGAVVDPVEPGQVTVARRDARTIFG